MSDRESTLTQEEWLERYKRRLIERADLPEDAAASFVEAAGTFEELSEMFEDDPEGAADSEMSYWEAD